LWAELNIGGAWVYTPQVWEDKRGSFFEMFRGHEFAEHLGYPLGVAQVNCSVTRQGVIRGIHFADVPPGQAKYVCCVSGAILDVVVDLRVGSPTFKTWEAVELNSTGRRALFLAEGLGHGFTAVSPEATVVYLCSTPYAPSREHTVHALDPGLAIAWPDPGGAILSGRDAAAPTLEQARRDGLLPSYETCLDWGRSLSSQTR
jgi:dTDP-4-dehydrorhamnose 3,5-epimerase